MQVSIKDNKPILHDSHDQLKMHNRFRCLQHEFCLLQLNFLYDIKFSSTTS